MARSERTPDDLVRFADRLKEAAADLIAAAAAMNAADMPSALLHGDSQANTYLPYIEEWAGKVHLDVRSQVRAFEDGRRSRVQLDKAANDKRKKIARKVKKAK